MSFVSDVTNQRLTLLYVQNVKELRKDERFDMCNHRGRPCWLHSLKAIKEETRGITNGRQIRFFLIDMQPGHLRKMLVPANRGPGGDYDPLEALFVLRVSNSCKGRLRPWIAGENRFVMRMSKEIRPSCGLTFWSWRSAALFSNRNPIVADCPD
ncbi:hypothetical protein GGC63_004264 [Paenibacillus sp. OAS669]|nr:hypothetical protein [Paenibacillus sp. OAS669]